MNLARGLACVLLAAPLAAAAAESVTLERLPADISPHDPVSLQRGAQVYVNYCIGCHSAAYMRYNRLQDLGLTPQQIRDNLIFTGAKVGDLMTIAMPAKESKEWFGAPPPDLTLIARSRSSGAGSGADWLYSYLRGFYRDSSRPTGWNNTVYPNVAMPHVLWQLQGEQVLRTEVVSIPRGTKGEVEKHEVQKLALEKPGTMNPSDYDRMVGDLVNFLVYVAEPSRQSRVDLGIYVLMFLGLLFVFAYLLKKEYWKDVR
ncbi:MAG TPA: cytochrome c1 [Burkholderiales bacterium]|jgi:ubiquinol-cytochrome c reductase cytochrome c1 subunit